jgi:hypothetical protein
VVPESATHWLWRLDAPAWLAAAAAELEQADALRESRRAALTHARRSGGMALNAVLVAWGSAGSTVRPQVEVETIWGRSYMDHLRRVATADSEVLGPLPPEAATAAQGILKAPMEAAPLVQLGAAPGAKLRPVAAAARTLLQLCTQAVGGSRTDV